MNLHGFEKVMMRMPWHANDAIQSRLAHAICKSCDYFTNIGETESSIVRIQRIMIMLLPS